MTNQQLLNCVEFMFVITECVFDEDEPMTLSDGTDLREAMEILAKVLTRNEPIV